jgi:hypothetical protein
MHSKTIQCVHGLCITGYNHHVFFFLQGNSRGTAAPLAAGCIDCAIILCAVRLLNSNLCCCCTSRHAAAAAAATLHCVCIVVTLG